MIYLGGLAGNLHSTPNSLWIWGTLGSLKFVENRELHSAVSLGILLYCTESISQVRT
jgi:hypothetical protein